MTKTKYIIKEESGSQRRACVENIRQYCTPMLRNYLDVPLLELPPGLRGQLDRGASERLFNAVANNQNGSNKLVDFLRINLYNDFFIKRNCKIAKYLKGISRIVCNDCGYYSFSTTDMKGGWITTFRKILMILEYTFTPEELDGLGLDADFNGMDYQRFVEFFREAVDNHKNRIENELNSAQINGQCDYDIIRVPDKLIPFGVGHVAKPTEQGRNFLNALSNYTTWCICEPRNGDWEYEEYTQCGGAFYICLKKGFREIEKPSAENGVEPNALDEYGLSMIAVLVGSDGYPENITTRWNHDYEGENNKMLYTAPQLQQVLNVNYRKIFKPRSPEELHQMHLDENKSKKNTVKMNKNSKKILSEAQFCKLIEEATMRTLRQIIKEDGEEGNAVENNIRRFCNPQVARYLDTPLSELPDQMRQAFAQQSPAFTQLMNTGGHDLMSFLKRYMFQQIGIDENSGIARMLPGISRLLCHDCNLFSFDGSADPNKILDLLDALKGASEGEALRAFNSDLNGMSCEEVINAITRQTNHGTSDFDFDGFINGANLSANQNNDDQY